jgi:hypothetical protein
MNDEGYKNSIGSFLSDVFGKTARKKEIDAMTALANEPAVINPVVYLIPVAAVIIFAGIYFIILKKKTR